MLAPFDTEGSTAPHRQVSGQALIDLLNHAKENGALGSTRNEKTKAPKTKKVKKYHGDI